MKKIILSFLFVLIVGVSFADTYTVDKRLYVTDDMWQTVPFKHILKMGYSYGDPWCTANMIAGKIVTAKHCVVDELPDLSGIMFIAYDGTRIYVESKPLLMGNYVEKKAETHPGDWVILQPLAKYTDFVEKNSLDISRVNGDQYRPTANSETEVFNTDFMAIGCGALRIMSDEEIEKFKMAYVDFLDEKQNGEGANSEGKYDDLKYETVYTRDEGYGEEFYWHGDRYLAKYGLNWLDLFDDTNNIKVSYCSEKWKNSRYNAWWQSSCQTWGGNSGGGAFSLPDPVLKDMAQNWAASAFYKQMHGKSISDSGYANPLLLGIVTRGSYGIGFSHARSGSIVPAQNFKNHLENLQHRKQ